MLNDNVKEIMFAEISVILQSRVLDKLDDLNLTVDLSGLTNRTVECLDTNSLGAIQAYVSARLLNDNFKKFLEEIKIDC